MPEPSPWRSLGSSATVGLTFVVATAGATIVGYYADRWLGTSPWLTLVGLVMGIAAGFRESLPQHQEGRETGARWTVS